MSPSTAQAIGLLRSKQQPDGPWVLDRVHAGEVHCPTDDGAGRPTRWDTLRALPVLSWY